MRPAETRGRERARAERPRVIYGVAHRTRAIFDRYNVVDEADLWSAAEKLERYTKRRKAERAARLVRVK